MKLAKEPNDIDLFINSEPWAEKDLFDFRQLMQEIKKKNKYEKNPSEKERVEIKPPRKAA